MDLYSQPTYDYKQKFIHWATRGKLNNHYNNKGLLGMKRWRMVTGLLQSWLGLPILLYWNHMSYMTVHSKSVNTYNDQIGETGTKLWAVF